MAGQADPGAMFVEQAGDRDAVAGISGAWPGWCRWRCRASLSRVPISAEAVANRPAELDGAHAGTMAVPAGPCRCQTG
jgi:hypothetical protein